MQPCSREMQGMPSSLNGISSSASAAAAQIALHELQNGHHHQIQSFDHPSAAAASHDDFFDQMLSTLPSWPDLGNPKSPWDAAAADGSNGQKLFNLALSGKPPEDSSPAAGDGGLAYAPYDESTLLASRLRQHQISGGGGGGSSAGKPMAPLQLNHHQVPMILPQIGRSPATGAESGLLPLPLSLGSGGGGGGGGDSRLLVDRSRDEVDASFKSPNSTGAGEGGLYNGFAGSLQRAAQAASQQHFHHPQGAASSMPQQSFGGAPVGGGGQQGTAAGSAGGAAPPPRQRLRARRGQATDPHSIAERLRRERIAERMKALQELVPNANKTDKASMLDEIIDYVKFLQLQVKVLSMSRLGGAAAVAPLVSDISSEGPAGRGGGASAASDSLTGTEHQVAKMMEEDMGSAMQYLQGKGLCLMPISLASAISTATCHPRASAAGAALLHHSGGGGGGGDAPTSPSMSVLTVQSAVAGGGGGDGGENVSRPSGKDAASVSKP